MTDNQVIQQDDTQITSIADAVVKLKEIRESNKNLNEPDIEERFARLALAFKTDRFTLNKRLELQRRQRDIAEKNVDSELRCLRESLNALNQLCTESDMRDIITKTQQHVDIVQQATSRMSNRAETYGAIQQEERLNCAFETMLNYVEHLKLLYDKEHLELEEYRRLLAEHNLLAGEKGALDPDDLRRSTLPPRSHSLSSSSKPESRTRLLSAVCLLNNNYEAPKTPPISHSSSIPGSTSPKSRRASLPVGPLSSKSHSITTVTESQQTVTIKSETLVEKTESPVKSDNEIEMTQKMDVDVKENSGAVEELLPAEKPAEKNSRDISSYHLVRPESDCATPLQVSACDNDAEEVCLLPAITIPIKPKPLYLLNLLHWASFQGPRRWDSATLILHARYTLSIMLATAAMLTFVLTFVPGQALAHSADARKDL